MIKALALDNFWSPVFSKTKSPSFTKNKASSPRLWLAIGLIAANAVLLMSYIYGVNEYASKGYEIQTLQNRLGNLNTDNKQVTLKIAEATSMVSIQSDFLSANFVPAGTPKFLTTNDQFTYSNK